jgi:apolipoprotein N-acyltransferase
MDKLRRFFWNIGISPNRETLLIVGAILITCLVVVVFGFFPAMTSNRLVRVLFVLIAVPGVVIVLGSAYRPLSWGLSDKQGRDKIEKETTIKILRRWLSQAPTKESTRESGKGSASDTKE